MDRTTQKPVRSVLDELYSRAVCGRVGIALDQWKLSHPGVQPDFLIAGEQLRSMMSIAEILQLSGGNYTYGHYVVLFCDAFDVCMFASKNPS